MNTPTKASTRIAEDLATYEPTEAAIADLRQRLSGIIVRGVEDREGLKVARAAKKELTGYRTALENRRKELKADALAYGRAVDTRAREILASLLEIEDPITMQIEAVKAEAARIEQEAAARARAVFDARTAALAAVGAHPPGPDVWGWTEAEYAQALAEATQAHEEAKAAEAARRAAEEAERAAFAEAQAALAAERAALAEERRQLDEAKARQIEADRRAAVEREAAREHALASPPWHLPAPKIDEVLNPQAAMAEHEHAEPGAEESPRLAPWHMLATKKDEGGRCPTTARLVRQYAAAVDSLHLPPVDGPGTRQTMKEHLRTFLAALEALAVGLDNSDSGQW